MIGTAIPYARMSCVAVDRGASALLEHNLFGAANYGVHVVGSKARDAAVVRGNVVRGSLDGIFVEGRAEVLDKEHFPTITLRTSAASGAWPQPIVRVAVTLKGVEREHEIPVVVERDADGQVWVGGESVTCITGTVTL